MAYGGLNTSGLEQGWWISYRLLVFRNLLQDYCQFCRPLYEYPEPQTPAPLRVQRPGTSVSEFEAHSRYRLTALFTRSVLV